MEDKNKLQEDIIKADIKSVEKLWKNAVDENTLDALLSKMTKDELVKVAKKYSVKGMTTLKKADAVEKLKNVIVESQDKLLASLEENTLKFLIDLINENGLKKYECSHLIYSNFLRNRGIVFTGTMDEELYVILPEELRESLKNQINNEISSVARLRTELIRVIAGMTYYYGVIKYTAIKEILEGLYSTVFTEEYIKDLIADGEELGYDYVIEEDGLCHIDVEDADKIQKLQQENSKYICKFDKKSLIKAGAPDFMEENKRGANLERAIGEMFVIDKNILKEEMDCFTVGIKNEMDINEAVDIFLEAYEIESDDERNIFTYELEHFAKTIKRWSLNGYSQDEVSKMEQRVVNEVKIGRNDPCICGSNKKYKKCCGK